MTNGELTSAAEIFCRGTIPLRYCFAECVEKRGPWLKLFRPFRCAVVDDGLIECREDHPELIAYLPVRRFGFAWIDVADWMQLERQEVLWAVEICRRNSRRR